ncbi:hypothetical protein [Bacteriovorax sp. Seq25_V]|uniref:hypothetical protein n=1 Tax=Bacteriovorax sp. Seq25_V TaxID=1201288 RepID=UPI00038A4203|nr:hypothetical protein [Bacteriovorax sp. Seq25_V]EQC47534.1 hypothetical protein M900_0687 [Bacteriovorax sp. Seq25_V]
MKIRFGKPLYIYFVSAMILIMAMMSFGIYYYWTKGTANIDGVAQVFDSTTAIENLEKKGGIETVKDHAQNDRLRDAISYFDGFAENVKKLEEVQSTDNYEEITKSFNALKNSMSKMLTYTSNNNLIDVLRSKVISFENFVVHNNWRTLTRVSKKINAKISSGATSSPGFFSYRKMKSLHDSLEADIKYMESVTMSSVLAQEDKNLILLKLDTLKTELNMMDESLNSLNVFHASYINAEAAYKNWLVEIKPRLTERKLDVIKNSQTILYGMFGLTAVVICLFAGGYLVYFKYGRKQKEEVEKIIMSVIKDNLIPLNTELDKSWSVDFKDNLEKYREYVHKRMSFGSIFQDAMPFSSILLDSNLNMVWANTLFYEHWNLDEKVKTNSNISWDFLQRFTNLGENDPVIEAIRDNIAGIYQIQVKTEKSEEAAPFEMYVSPVEYAGQKRIMVIFYPLRSLEETLGNQMKALVSPVSKTLDALVEGKFQGDFKEKVQGDFEAAGIDHIFKKFDKVNDFFNNQRNGLMEEIDTIENSLFEQYKLMDDVRIVFEAQKDLQHEAISKFSSAKNDIISVVDMRSQFEQMLTQMNEIGNSLFAEEVSLLSRASEVTDIMGENSKAIDSLVKSRDEFKRLKSQVEMFKSRVSNILEHSRNSDAPSKNAQGIQRLKTELLEFENVLTSFSKVSTALDVGLSKIQIITQSKKMPNLSDTKRSFEELRAQIEEIQAESTKMGRLGQERDEELIKSLKGLFLSFQNLRAKSNEVEEVLNEEPAMPMPPDHQEIIAQDI